MTKVAEKSNLNESHWLLIFGEDVRYLPTTLSALFDRQLMHVPHKVTVYHEQQRYPQVVKPQLGTRLCEHKAVFDSLSRLTPIRKDGTLIESVNTETDLDAVKESLERFVRAASDDKKAPLQIMMMGVDTQYEDIIRRAILLCGTSHTDLFVINTWHPAGIRTLHYHKPAHYLGSEPPDVIDLKEATFVGDEYLDYQPEFPRFIEEYAIYSHLKKAYTNDLYFAFTYGSLVIKPQVVLKPTRSKWALHIDDEMVPLPDNLCTLLAWILIRTLVDRPTYIVPAHFDDAHNFWLRYQYWQCLSRITSPIKANNAGSQIFGLSMDRLDRYMNAISYHQMPTGEDFYDQLVKDLTAANLIGLFNTGNDLFQRKITSDRTKLNNKIKETLASNQLSSKAAAVLAGFMVNNMGHKGLRHYHVSYDDYGFLKIDDRVAKLFEVCGYGPRYWQSI